MPHHESPSPELIAKNFGKVWASVLTSSSYLPGCLTLHYSLQKAGTKYPFIVFYIDTLPTETLDELALRSIPTRRVPILMPTIINDYGDDARFNDAWTKLTAFSLTDFEKIVLLDLDMLVVRNMDELMDVQLDEMNRIFAAVHSCTCNPNKRSTPLKDWPSSCTQYITAAWEWDPDICPFASQHANPDIAQVEGPPTTINATRCLSTLAAPPNAGLLVIRPSLPLYNIILKTLSNSALISTFRYSEQELLQNTFPNRWVSLSYIYNAIKTMRWKDVHTDIWDDDCVKNVHFIFREKPWSESPRERRDKSRDPLHSVWWVYNQERVEMERKLWVLPLEENDVGVEEE